jgi:hypothetical protein
VVTSATADRLEIQLDAEHSLEGWGGAPVIAADADRALGIVEAVVPGTGAPRVLAAPIGGALDALRDPLEGGKGRRFAEFAPAVSPSPAPGATAAAKPADADKRRGLIQPTTGKATNLDLAIEYPRDGAQVSSTVCGTFVAGRAQATRGAPRRFDVMVVIDTSRSTLQTAGSDVNGNGVVGEPRMGGFGAMVGAGLTDDGDSILAAEVAAARRVLAGSIRAARASGSSCSRASRPGRDRRASPLPRSWDSRASTTRSRKASTSCSRTAPTATRTWRPASIRRCSS